MTPMAPTASHGASESMADEPSGPWQYGSRQVMATRPKSTIQPAPNPISVPAAPKKRGGMRTPTIRRGTPMKTDSVPRMTTLVAPTAPERSPIRNVFIGPRDAMVVLLLDSKL